MIKTLQNTLKQDKERFTVPRSVQDIIPIRRIWPDGVFQFGSKYSKTLRFSDINYAIASKEDIVPFVDHFPKNKLYRLMTTKPSDLAA